jgi:hypothetical protein
VHDATWPEDNPDDFTMVPMGTGSVPHLEAIRLMAAEPAEIALSLEWESSDRPEVVLPREAAMLRKYLAEAG